MKLYNVLNLVGAIEAMSQVQGISMPSKTSLKLVKVLREGRQEIEDCKEAAKLENKEEVNTNIDVDFEWEGLSEEELETINPLPNPLIVDILLAKPSKENVD